ncbi:MAG: DUF6585 family protein [Cyanobacteria bacterium J06626_23]
MKMISLGWRPSPADITAEHQLGELIAIYRPNSWTVFYVVSGSILGALAYGLFSEGGWFRLVAVLFGFVSLFLFYNVYANSWLFFSEGIVRRQGRRGKLIDYTEVVTLFADVRKVVVLLFGFIPLSGGKRQSYKLSLCKTVREMPLHFSDENLGRFLEGAVCRAQLPGLLENYRAQQDLNFGPLRISHSGICRTQKGLPLLANSGELGWAELHHMTVQRGHLCLYRQGQDRPWVQVACHKIPNFQTLLVLLVEKIGVSLMQTS